MPRAVHVYRFGYVTDGGGILTKREAIRQTAQENTLRDLGCTMAEADALRRISMTLHRWAELTPDRETGARKRLVAILGARNARADVNSYYTRGICVY